jgi:hypothetical protein
MLEKRVARKGTVKMTPGKNVVIGPGVMDHLLPGWGAR